MMNLAPMLRGGLWQYVYLLEYYPSELHVVPTKSFAFGVPPETEEISLGMRKTETKTFGGLVIDDYGIDNAIKISLSGSSVNNDLRLIYRPRGMSSYLTGEQEIFTFKKFLEEIKERGNLKGKCLLYDLSKHSDKAQKQFNGIETFCWKVYPGDLKIKRSKEKPFTYTYSIDFTAIPHATSILIKPKKKPPVIEILTWFDKLMAWLNNLINKIKSAVKFVKNIIKSLKDAIKNIRQKIQMVKDTIKAIVTGSIDFFKGIANDLIDVFNEGIALFHDVTAGVAELGLEIADYACFALLDVQKNIVNAASSFLAIGTKEFYVKESSLTNLKLFQKRQAEIFSGILGKAHYTASKVSMEMKSNDFMRENILPGGRDVDIYLDDNVKYAPPYIEEHTVLGAYSMNGENGDVDSSNNDDNKGENVRTYGAKVFPIEDGESFESIAISEWGDVTKASLLAKVNDASSITELKAKNKDTIIIPVLTPPITNTSNEIIGFSWQRDVYGVDIALDDNGCMHFNKEGTDFELISGKANLAQAILDRLKESVKKRVLQQYYGIIHTIPDGPLGNAYILSSIIQTLQLEPRIKEILSVSFKGAGDALWIEIHYVDIGDNENKLQGVV